MAIESTFLAESEIIKPSIELGAFEALWSVNVSSFKQLREKLVKANEDLLSKLIDTNGKKILFRGC